MSVAHQRYPAAASFEEIHLARHDQRHVPILVWSMTELGQLGNRDKADVDRHLADLKDRKLKKLRKVKRFFNIISGDERASIALVVRAMATLYELAKAYDDLKEKLEYGAIDRWVWLTMREIVSLNEENLTFRVDKTAEQWYAWAVNTEPVSKRSDNDEFYLGDEADVFLFSDLEGMLELCPIAANRPLEKPPSGREILSRGLLAGQFAKHPNHSSGNFYRTCKPVWTAHYDDAMAQMFPPGSKPPPMPIMPTFPEPPPSNLNMNPVGIHLARMYEYMVRKYSDDRAAGTTMIMVQLMKLLHDAVIRSKPKRFWDLVDMHDQWKANGWLTVTVGATVKSVEDAKFCQKDYKAGISEHVAGDGQYVKDLSPRKRLRQDSELLQKKQKRKKLLDVEHRDQSGDLKNRGGDRFSQAPMHAGGVNLDRQPGQPHEIEEEEDEDMDEEDNESEEEEDEDMEVEDMIEW